MKIRANSRTIIANLAVTEISEQPSVAGAAFNFTLKRGAVEKKRAPRDERQLKGFTAKIVIDFGSLVAANAVGHIQHFLSDALART